MLSAEASDGDAKQASKLRIFLRTKAKAFVWSATKAVLAGALGKAGEVLVASFLPGLLNWFRRNQAEISKVASDTPPDVQAIVQEAIRKSNDGPPVAPLE